MERPQAGDSSTAHLRRHDNHHLPEKPGLKLVKGTMVVSEGGSMLVKPHTSGTLSIQKIAFKAGSKTSVISSSSSSEVNLLEAFWNWRTMVILSFQQPPPTYPNSLKTNAEAPWPFSGIREHGWEEENYFTNLPIPRGSHSPQWGEGTRKTWTQAEWKCRPGEAVGESSPQRKGGCEFQAAAPQDTANYKDIDACMELKWRTGYM